MVMIASRLNLGLEKLGSAKTGAAATAEKSRRPHANAAAYPAMTAIRIGMTEKNFLNRMEPNTAVPSVIMNTIILPGSITGSKRPAFSAALPESSRPIRATTGPMAAGGRTTLIHSVPNL